MRRVVPPSRPDDLNIDGASIRIWHDSRDKLKELARLRGKKMAETFDELVHAALQAARDAEASRHAYDEGT